jgi:hypothetical protein
MSQRSWFCGSQKMQSFYFSLFFKKPIFLIQTWYSSSSTLKLFLPSSLSIHFLFFVYFCASVYVFPFFIYLLLCFCFCSSFLFAFLFYPYFCGFFVLNLHLCFCFVVSFSQLFFSFSMFHSLGSHWNSIQPSHMLKRRGNSFDWLINLSFCLSLFLSFYLHSINFLNFLNRIWRWSVS